MTLQNARRILVCLRYGIGDVVMELPVLEALRRHAPAAWITALASSPADELLVGDPRVDEVVSVSRWGLTHRWDEGTPESREALARWIESADFDAFLDVHHAVVAVGKVVWGRGIRSLEADEASEAAAVAAGLDAAAAIRAAVRAGWGIDVPESLHPRVPLTVAELRRADAFLADAGAGDPPPIAVSPVASLPMKRWPADRFAAVADRLTEQTGRRILLVIGPEAAAGEAILVAMRHRDRAIPVGAEPLRHIAAVLAQSAVFLSNDTGLLHLAAAVGTPVVGIFGPSVPEIYRPPVPNAQALVADDIACPYRNTASLHPPGCWSSPRCLIAEKSCVTKVPIEAVLAAAHRALGRVGRLSRGRPKQRRTPPGPTPA